MLLLALLFACTPAPSSCPCGEHLDPGGVFSSPTCVPDDASQVATDTACLSDTGSGPDTGSR